MGLPKSSSVFIKVPNVTNELSALINVGPSVTAWPFSVLKKTVSDLFKLLILYDWKTPLLSWYLGTSCIVSLI